MYRITRVGCFGHSGERAWCTLRFEKRFKFLLFQELLCLCPIRIVVKAAGVQDPVWSSERIGAAFLSWFEGDFPRSCLFYFKVPLAPRSPFTSALPRCWDDFTPPFFPATSSRMNVWVKSRGPQGCRPDPLLWNLADRINTISTACLPVSKTFNLSIFHFNLHAFATMYPKLKFFYYF